MAETYTKKLYTITITMNNMSTFTVEDTANCMAASQVLYDLRSRRSTIVYVDEEEYIIFPSGVSFIKVETTESEPIPIPDPS